MMMMMMIIVVVVVVIIIIMPSLGQLYSALEGREHLKGQLEVMFKKRTLN